MVNNKIEILARIFYDLKGMENYRGLRFRLSSEEVILVRSYFFKYGLKATSVYSFFKYEI